MPIEIPAIPLAELNRLTSNFGEKSSIGEGSYGKVFHAILSTGETAAIKKLDPSVSNDPDSDFAAQVINSYMSESVHGLAVTSHLSDSLFLVMVGAVIDGFKT